MKVKDLVSKVAGLGPDLHIYIQKGFSIVGGGVPEDVISKFAEFEVVSFRAVNRDQIKILVQ